MHTQLYNILLTFSLKIILSLYLNISSLSLFLSLPPSLFLSTLPPTDLCELQATVKHKALIGGEQVLGVASVPFDIIMKSRLYTMNLNSSLLHNEKGRAFLTVLALRSSDEIARDFVTLRTHQRQEMV